MNSGSNYIKGGILQHILVKVLNGNQYINEEQFY